MVDGSIAALFTWARKALEGKTRMSFRNIVDDQIMWHILKLGILHISESEWPMTAYVKMEDGHEGKNIRAPLSVLGGLKGLGSLGPFSVAPKGWGRMLRVSQVGCPPHLDLQSLPSFHAQPLQQPNSRKGHYAMCLLAQRPEPPWTICTCLLRGNYYH